MPWRSRLYLSQSSGLCRQSEMTTIFSVLRLFLRGLGSKALPCEEAQWLNFLKKKAACGTDSQVVGHKEAQPGEPRS